MGSSASNLGPMDPEPKGNYIPAVEDVFNVRHALLERIPPELANIILDEARYWPVVTTAFNPQSDAVVAASRSPESNAAIVLIMTPRLSDWIGLDIPVKIRELRIEIVSHDQGWCGEDPNLPPYAASWTWFEAAIIRDRSSADSDPETDDDVRHFLEDTRRELQPSVQTVRNPHSKEASDIWIIQRNARASKSHSTHQIIWTVDNTDDIETGESLDDTGEGRGAGFVSSLEMGDRIAIIARARFPGWENKIKMIELELAYSI